MTKYRDRMNKQGKLTAIQREMEKLGMTQEQNLLTVDDYKNAIDACSACNVSGLIGVMNEVKDRIWVTDRKYGIGTYFVNHHPIIQLYAYQIAYLSHGREPIEWSGFSDAYKFCKAVVAGEILPDSNWIVSITTCYHNRR